MGNSLASTLKKLDCSEFIVTVEVRTLVQSYCFAQAVLLLQDGIITQHYINIVAARRLQALHLPPSIATSSMPSPLAVKPAFLLGRRLIMTPRCRQFVLPAAPGSIIAFSSSTGDNQEWRKTQLDRLRNKFEDTPVIESDEELQPMWKEMESRVVKRRSRTIEEAGGKVGRSNIRKTDEEAWLLAGMYDQDDEEKGEAQNKPKEE